MATYVPLPMSGSVDVGLPPKRTEHSQVVYREFTLHNEGPGWFGRPPDATD
ncbi:hypothetical protein [Sporichthya polymorpha]|uniref:hypothetical protein n=1 Tax=Sporichthya polymorpha TaxID=35751 RepID=UPI000375C299|nr:hypothetical protein [Sporichthya polymorpha]